MTYHLKTNTLTAIAFAAASTAPASAGELNIYNWADYFGETSVSSFKFRSRNRHQGHAGLF